MFTGPMGYLVQKGYVKWVWKQAYAAAKLAGKSNASAGQFARWAAKNASKHASECYMIEMAILLSSN